MEPKTKLILISFIVVLPMAMIPSTVTAFEPDGPTYYWNNMTMNSVSPSIGSYNTETHLAEEYDDWWQRNWVTSTAVPSEGVYGVRAVFNLKDAQPGDFNGDLLIRCEKKSSPSGPIIEYIENWYLPDDYSSWTGITISLPTAWKGYYVKVVAIGFTDEEVEGTFYITEPIVQYKTYD